MPALHAEAVARFTALPADLMAASTDPPRSADLERELNARFPACGPYHPTVTARRALVLYLLPGGAIEFTPAAA